MELFRLLGTIAIDNQNANKEIDDTTDKAEKSEGKMSAAFKKIGKAVATAFAVAKIVDFGKQCVAVAAEAKALNSQFEQVFDGIGKSAEKSLQRVSEQTGIVDTRLKGSFTKIAAFAKTTGMETADALNLTERATLAAADSAAYYDRSIEEVTENLQSFLKGNYENDAALGLSCTETTRNAAANKLYGKSFKDLSESQKQLTLLQMVEDANKLSGAMGQAAREADGWENVTGNLKASLQKLMVTIGSPILTAAVPIVKALADGFIWLDEKVRIFLNESGIIEKFKEIAGVLIPAIKKAYDNFLKPVLELTVSFLKTVLIPTFLLLLETASKVVSGIVDFFTGMKNSIVGVKNFIKGIIEDIKKFFNFKVELPKIKLPHFSIKPKGWGLGDLLKGKIPKLGIEWYAKGGVFNRPTIFPTSQGYKGVGEAGKEAVAPISVLQSYVSDAVRQENYGLIDRLETLISLLRLYLPTLADRNVVLDTGLLVGGLMPEIDAGMGKIYAGKERGR